MNPAVKDACASDPWSARNLRAQQTLPEDDTPSFVVERTRNREHGDFACNVALILAKQAGRKPRDIATAIVAAIDDPRVERIEIAGPGFINFFLGAAALHAEMANMLGRAATRSQRRGRRGKLQIEFVSANHPRPCTVGHGRGDRGLVTVSPACLRQMAGR